MKRVLVTGANGFVGQAACETLPEAGFEVRAAVRKADRMPSRSFEGEVLAVGDIDANTAWEPALKDVDAVVHLAGRVHVLTETFADPQAEFYKVNVYGAEYLARAAAKAGVRRMVYVSSIGVNGRATSANPFTEEHVPNPHNPYTVSKWEAEQALQRVSEESGMELVILRPPLIYGPGVKANFLRLMRLVESGLPLPLSSIDNRRSLIYVRNLTAAVATSISNPDAPGETFLVSDGEDVSTPELISAIARALDRPARLLPFPPQILGTIGRVSGKLSAIEPLLDSLMVDSMKIRRMLGWQPPYSMAEGLRETADWYKAGR